MSLLPITLSTTLRQALSPESQFANEDELVAKLKTLPCLMLAFFNQAVASYPYMKRHESLVTKVIYEINLQVHALGIPYDEMFKSMSVCFKYFPFSPKIIPTDLVIVYENQNYFFNALVMMKDCAVLKNNWILNQTWQYPLHDLAAALSNIEEFKALYTTFFNCDFTQFNLYKNECLFRLAVQAELWGYVHGSRELQEIICKRLIHYSDLIESYGKAKFSNLSYLESYCEDKLDQFEFSYVVQGGFNYFITARFDFGIEYMSYLRPAERVQFCDQYYEEHFSPEKNCPASLEIIEFATDSEGAYVVKSITIRDRKDILEVRDSTKLFTKVKFDRSIITSWVLDGRNPLSFDQIYGMGFYYNAIHDVSFYYYEKIDEKFFSNFVKVVPNLQYLRIKDCKKIDDKVLIYIPTFLRALKSLILNKTHIYDGVLKFILNLPNLVRLEITDSSIVIPEFEGKFYKNILHLDISRCRLSGANLFWLLSCFPNLSILICENIPAFSLKLIPYPDNLTELRVHCDQLLDSIEKDNVDFASFTSLKHLCLIGRPCKQLKAHLPKWMGQMKVTFKN